VVACVTDVARRLEYQRGHAVVWRDAINQWFRKTSGIPDTRGRVDALFGFTARNAGGGAPGPDQPRRFEAESATLAGFSPVAVKPWETASRETAVACTGAGPCVATWKYAGPAGAFDLHVLYYDENDGVSQFRLAVGGRTLREWTADNDLPTKVPDGHSATRLTFEQVPLRAGDEIRLEAVPDAGEQAVVDYAEVTPGTD